MYIPKAFAMDDPQEIARFLRDHSFGLLISTSRGELTATHLPFVFDADGRCLWAHMARANPQWRDLHGQTALVVFQGPHAYVSPSWYEVPQSVPTWNYVAVHVYGRCTVIEDESELADLLAKTVRFYEPDSRLPEESGEPYYRNLMRAVVGFRLDIERMEGKAKLSQNKPPEVRRRVIEALGRTGDAEAQEVAAWMRRLEDGR
ncbi:FMN-binding negative transcriptional regulator [Alicyclobacillus macrosporangiidus]|uniref:Transcriptional regulator n=1 Tax=Alicyclobacillus macrosporangiidus TaxID=392015 RepID=A0A1I7LAS2_9BACL|nr:FMN-binding negative transcriptional regulator [Alicyclobacillus macrosporangiidus]SFV06795.1 transcriptional regulator [Alicyclobacillus macrosporangiidus]